MCLIDIPRDTSDKIEDYFTNFCKLEPQGTILQSFVQIGANWCKDSGIYEFVMGATGAKVKARYTFLYKYEDGQWKIAHHHSSQMPEEVEPKNKSTTEVLSQHEVRNLFNLWNDALATLDASTVAARYAKVGWLSPFASFAMHLATQIELIMTNILFLFFVFIVGRNPSFFLLLGKRISFQLMIVYPFIPVISSILYTHFCSLCSDKPRTDVAGITEYFQNFLKMKPQGKILEGQILAGNEWAQDAGLYEFTMGATGNKVLARYSFVYVFEDGEWKIAHHHSSVMPEGILNAPKGEVLADDEVRGLFQLWNNALATGDPTQVAARYSKNAILLPTVSDTPRKTKDQIIDYFESFLKIKPQGVITQGLTVSGEDWCKDAGVYEFTMGATGEKVLARYSFVYVKEDGEWKIAHHHSSAMPEEMMAAASKIKKLEAILAN
jgi:uncharacterized protein (TIGR02246 family)